MKTIHSALRQPFALLSCLLLAAATTATAQTHTDSTTGLTYTIANNKATVTGITSGSLPADGKLVIPETLGGAPVTAIGVWAFSGNATVQELSAPSVITINYHSFSHCTSLSTISLPEAASIVGHAFQDCTALTTVSLSKAASIAGLAFFNCTSLTEVSLPEAASIVGPAFKQCTALTTVSLPKAVSIGDYAFQDCTALTSVSLPEAVSIGGSAYLGCTALTDISLPEATSIGDSAFQGCTSLTKVSLPEANYIAFSAFEDCESLGTLSLPKVELIQVAAFKNCTRLQTVFLPELKNLYDHLRNTSKLFAQHFQNCTSLKNVYLGEAPGLFNDDAFTNTHADLTIHHHPEYRDHFANGHWQPLNKNEVIRPFSGPVGIASGTDSATLRIRHAAKTSGDDWTYTVEQSTDLAAWAEATPSASDSNTADSVVTKSRTVPASTPAAFYRVQAKPNFFGTD